MNKSHESKVKFNWRRWPKALQEQMDKGLILAKDKKNIEGFIKNVATSAYKEGKFSLHQQQIQDLKKLFNKDIGMLRQWLNEDRIKDGSRFVTNEELKTWFDDIIFLLESEEEKKDTYSKVFK